MRCCATHELPRARVLDLARWLAPRLGWNLEEETDEAACDNFRD